METIYYLWLALYGYEVDYLEKDKRTGSTIKKASSKIVLLQPDKYSDQYKMEI